MIESTNSASKHHKKRGEEAKDFVGRILKIKIKKLIDQINVERGESIKENVHSHWKNLETMLLKVKSVLSKRGPIQTEKNTNMLSSRIENPLYKLDGICEGVVEKNYINGDDFSSVKSITIPHKKKLSPYTSWVYVARNMKMAEDQSVIGKYQIYYNKNKGETMLCSDSEEEMVKLDDAKHDFTEAEDRILWMALEEYEPTEEVLRIIKEFVKTTDSQIQGRYEKLKEKNTETLDQHSKDYDGEEYEFEMCLEKSLSASIESFDNLFCRQCMIFDCPMHGSSQPLIYPSIKQPAWSDPEGDRRPCSDQCYLVLKDVNSPSQNSTHEIEFNQLSNSSIEMHADRMQSNSTWNTLERDLHLKGVAIFGKNSCLISQNLLLGLKTCLEVARYMCDNGELMLHGSIPSSMMDTDEQINAECKDQEMPSQSRLLKKKGRPRKFTNSRKSAGLPTWWRRIAGGESLSYKQYTPCGCHESCGKNCPCLLRGTCCEKYCGCSKFCNNRFKGCQCVKSQCKSRQCPCFAANRECDPDVCRNCWVSCGDGSLGEPPRHGDGPCGNMNLLLGRKERILLTKSDIIGWGAFTKNPIQKNVCIGEYTGELITPREADKRGKVYIRINHSFIFNLNDQWVIDSRRLGGKLKFLNHSLKPNCYVKVLFVRGDHRIGIFAKENIEAGEEIFYDYSYDPECAPVWALPPKGDASKKIKNS